MCMPPIYIYMAPIYVYMALIDRQYTPGRK